MVDIGIRHIVFSSSCANYGVPAHLAIREDERQQPNNPDGDDYDTPDGTALRGYVHVTDLASAQIGALRYPPEGGASTAINPGGGTAYSVKEIIGGAEPITKAKLPLKVVRRRHGDAPAMVQRSSLREILETAWRWESRQGNRWGSR